MIFRTTRWLLAARPAAGDDVYMPDAASNTPSGIYCRKCGYDLRGQVAPYRCPECGLGWRWAKRGVILLLVAVVLGITVSCNHDGDGPVSPKLHQGSLDRESEDVRDRGAVRATTLSADEGTHPGKDIGNPIAARIELKFERDTWWCVYTVVNWGRSQAIVPDHPREVRVVFNGVTARGVTVAHYWLDRREDGGVSLGPGEGLIRMIELRGFAPRRARYTMTADFKSDQVGMFSTMGIEADLSSALNVNVSGGGGQKQ